MTHNVHGPHDEKFYTLLRQVEKEIVELDWRANQRGYSVKDDGKVGKRYMSDQYIPNGPDVSTGKATKTIYRLQDASNALSSSSSTLHNDSSSSIPLHQILPAGLMAAQAAMLRLSEEELENERGCGCGRDIQEKATVKYDESGEGNDELLCKECNEIEYSPAVDPSNQVVETVDVVEPTQQDETTSPNPDVIDLINVNSVIHEISNSLDESIVASLSMGSSSSVERLLMIRDSVQTLLNGLNSEGNYSRREVYNSLGLLKTLIGNAKDLSDEKYRSIKANSKKFENLITRIDGAMNLLEASGFERCDEEKKILLKRFDPVLLYMAFSFVDLCLNAIDKAMNETTVPSQRS